MWAWEVMRSYRQIGERLVESAEEEVMLSWKKKMEILEVVLMLGFYPSATAFPCSR